MKLKKYLGLLLVLLSGSFAVNTMAADNAAKEDLTPPAAEGPLTADQIPPISNIGKPMATQPQGSTMSPATSTTMPAAPTTIPSSPAPAGQMEQVPSTGR
ncbi:MAG: hypothetical protein ACYCQI_13390 [Gammaproteobacteria bacterium]